jgi:Predicted EndoIII-related endonuclease
VKHPQIIRILKILKSWYGPPPRRHRSDPVDEIVRTILSQNTSDSNSLAAFAVLKQSFRSWERLLETDTATLARLIKHAGLANIKAKRIKEVLFEIKRREGKLSLISLKSMDTGEAIDYLRSLKGIGPKTAACVLLFSFGRPVMPVDTHVYRVSRRLGLIPDDLDIEGAHRFLSDLVPKSLIYDFHLGIIEHGRKACKAQNPRCGVCLLYSLCKFTGKALFKRRSKN